MFEAGEEEYVEEGDEDLFLMDESANHLSSLGDETFEAMPDMYICRANSSEILFASPEPKSAKMIGPYIMGEKIGEGSYGKVKGALDSRSLRRVAVKIMKNKKLRKIPNGQANVKKEISLLRMLQHENVVELVDVFYNERKQKIYVVMEFCLGNIQELLDSEGFLPVWQAHLYFVQLMCGLDYLHCKGVIHRDIKPSNMLLAGGEIIKISDLGVADVIDKFSPNDDIETSSGTPAFQSPEVADGKDSFSGSKVDVWASGVTLWNMATGTYPFEGTGLFALYVSIVKGEFSMPESVDAPLASLLEGMLQRDPSDRFTVAQARAHEWVLMAHSRNGGARVFLPPDAHDDPDRGTTVAGYLASIYSDFEHKDDYGDDYLTASTDDFEPRCRASTAPAFSADAAAVPSANSPPSPSVHLRSPSTSDTSTLPPAAAAAGRDGGKPAPLQKRPSAVRQFFSSIFGYDKSTSQA